MPQQGGPFNRYGVAIGQGAAQPLKTTPAGAADQVFCVPSAGGEPGFGTVAVAGGGTGSALGALSMWGPFYGTAVLVASTVYLGRDDDTTELNVLWRASVTGTAIRMDSQASVAAGAGDTFTYTLRVNGADTALTHAVTGTGSGGRSGNSTGAVAFTAGQFISISLVTTATAGVANHQVTLAIRAAS